MRSAALSLRANLALAAALGIASGASCWLTIFRSELASQASRYLPGIILGAFLCIHGQLAFGRPRLSLVRACGLIVISLLAWRVAQEVHALAGSLKWLLASVMGALGIGWGLLLAWQPPDARGLLLGMTAGGAVGGLLLTLASWLGAARSGQVQWALLLLCAWHAVLLTTAALSLHLARHS